MKKGIITIITIFATIEYIVTTLMKIDFSNRDVFVGFLIFIFPTILRSCILGYFLIHSLFHKAKDIDNSNFTALVSLFGTNLSIFVGMFVSLQTTNPNADLSFWGTILSLLIVPFYLVGLITLGNNLTVLPEANTLNTKGIYSISRHPLYLCYIIWFVLQNLVCQTWIMILISVIQSIMLVIRAKYEEKLLVKNFPEYKDYRKTVMWLGRRKNKTIIDEILKTEPSREPEQVCSLKNILAAVGLRK